MTRSSTLSLLGWVYLATVYIFKFYRDFASCFVFTDWSLLWLLSVLLFVLGVLSLVTGLSAIVASSVKLLPATLNLFRILNPELFVQPVVAALRRRDPGCLYTSLNYSMT